MNEHRKDTIKLTLFKRGKRFYACEMNLVRLYAVS